MIEWTPLVCQGCGAYETEAEPWEDALCNACRASARLCSKCGEPESEDNPFPAGRRQCKLCIADYNYQYNLEHNEQILLRKRIYSQQMTIDQKEAHRKSARESMKRLYDKRRRDLN